MNSRIKSSKSEVPNSILFRNKHILPGRHRTNVRIIHPNRAEDLLLQDLSKGLVVGSLDDIAEQRQGNVGVDGVRVRLVHGRAAVDLAEELVARALVGAGEARAVGAGALGDGGEAEFLPWVGADDGEILGHYEVLVWDLADVRGG